MKQTSMTKIAPTLIAATALLAVAGCSKKAKPEDIPPAAADQGRGFNNNQPGGQNQANAGRKGSQEDFLASVKSDRIFFDTDKSDVDAEDQTVLRSQAQWLQANPTVRVTIEGHCDERGTRDYNIALGDKRANAAKNYLASIGIDAARISTISYGKERPAALGSDEESWAKNRRAVTVTVQQ